MGVQQLQVEAAATDRQDGVPSTRSKARANDVDKVQITNELQTISARLSVLESHVRELARKLGEGASEGAKEGGGTSEGGSVQLSAEAEAKSKREEEDAKAIVAAIFIAAEGAAPKRGNKSKGGNKGKGRNKGKGPKIENKAPKVLSLSRARGARGASARALRGESTWL